MLTINDKTQRIGIRQWYHVPANVELSAKFEVETDDIEPWLAIEPVLDEES